MLPHRHSHLPVSAIRSGKLQVRVISATYHDERVLHAEDSVTGQPFVALEVQCGDKSVVSGSFDHEMKVARPHVVPADAREKLADGPLHARSMVSMPATQ